MWRYPETGGNSTGCTGLKQGKDPISAEGGRAMKKQLEKKTLEKEAVLWTKAKNTLDRDDVRLCRK
jgi:hypothetical protein